VRFGKLIVDIATRQTLDAEHYGNDAAAGAATEHSERIVTNLT
jgi:hypothetical protein